MTRLVNKIYVFSCPLYEGLVKVGQTCGDVDKRIMREFPQHPVVPNMKPYELLYVTDAVDKYGDTFQDVDVFKTLKDMGFKHVSKEWFDCGLDIIKDAIEQEKLKCHNNRFPLNVEDLSQFGAISKTTLGTTIEDLVNSDYKSVIPEELPDYNRIALKALNNRSVKGKDFCKFKDFPVYLFLKYLFESVGLDVALEEEINMAYDALYDDFPHLKTDGFPIYMMWAYGFISYVIQKYPLSVLEGKSIEKPTDEEIDYLYTYYSERHKNKNEDIKFETN